MSIEWALQQSIYDVLSGSFLSVKGIYAPAPQSSDGGDFAAFPYVAIGRTIISQGDTQTVNGYECQIRLHTFSRSGSMKEAKVIQGEIYAALHRQPMTITGFNNFSLLREDTDCFSEPDGKVHGVCEYRALIETA